MHQAQTFTLITSKLQACYFHRAFNFYIFLNLDKDQLNKLQCAHLQCMNSHHTDRLILAITFHNLLTRYTADYAYEPLTSNSTFI